MIENKTKTTSTKSASNEQNLFLDAMKDEEVYNESPKKFFTQIQTLIDNGEYHPALKKLKNAEWFVSENELEKMAYVTYKMAETLQLLAASGIENDEASKKMLDEAEEYLDKSERYKKIKDDHLASGKKMYDDANDKYQMAIENDADDAEKFKIPLLNMAEDSLNKSDAHYGKANFNSGGEYIPTPSKKRRLRLGARAIMHAAKSSIKSALSRRN